MVISVADSGVGIPKEKRNELFLENQSWIDMLKFKISYGLPMYTGLDTDSSYGTNQLGTSSYYRSEEHTSPVLDWYVEI